MNSKNQLLSFHTALLVTIIFCVHTLFGSENTDQHLYPYSSNYQFCFDQNNGHVGNLDRYLFHEYLRFRYSKYSGQRIAGHYFCNLYDEILENCYVIGNEEKKGFSPFRISVSHPDSLKAIESHLSKTDFISKNKQNREYAEKVPSVISIDHCTYALKPYGEFMGVICYFFDRQVLLRMLIDFIKNLP